MLFTNKFFDFYIITRKLMIQKLHDVSMTSCHHCRLNKLRVKNNNLKRENLFSEIRNLRKEGKHEESLK